MKSTFVLESCSEKNISSLAEFTKAEYPGGEIADERFIAWEYFQNPSGHATVTIARNEQGTIAAQYAVIPVEVVAGHKIIMGSLSLNTLTGGQFRGQGLFAKTAKDVYGKCLDQGVNFTIGVPNRNSFSGFTSRLDFKHCGDLDFLVKPLRPIRVLQSFLNKEGDVRKGKDILLNFDEHALENKSVSSFDPEADADLYLEFWKRWSTENKILTHRSLPYLTWRYCKNPLRKYYLFKLVVNGEMRGLAVFRTLKVFGMRTCVLMEYCCLDNSGGTGFLKLMNQQMKKNQIDIAVCLSAGRWKEHRTLRKSGFVKVPRFLLPQRLPFIARIHKAFEGSELLLNLKNWHFTFGDYDIF